MKFGTVIKQCILYGHPLKTVFKIYAN